jgi:hypothetical protein
MRIDVTKVKRAILGNERLIRIAKAKGDGKTPAQLRIDHQWLIALRTGAGAESVPVEVAECYRAQGIEGRSRRAS